MRLFGKKRDESITGCTRWTVEEVDHTDIKILYFDDPGGYSEELLEEAELKEKMDGWFCICGEEDNHGLYCKACGVPTPYIVKECARCGEYAELAAESCSECGAPLETDLTDSIVGHAF
ncbi:hypothetical protein FACS1894219_04270 [Clostridia bacterium]|nr:hypothetical protein FACS1894219_04270 [Clostridia bacterium]